MCRLVGLLPSPETWVGTVGRWYLLSSLLALPPCLLFLLPLIESLYTACPECCPFGATVGLTTGSLSSSTLLHCAVFQNYLFLPVMVSFSWYEDSITVRNTGIILGSCQAFRRDFFLQVPKGYANIVKYSQEMLCSLC